MSNVQTVVPNLLLSCTVTTEHWQWGDVVVAEANLKLQCFYSKEPTVIVAVPQARTQPHCRNVAMPHGNYMSRYCHFARALASQWF